MTPKQIVKDINAHCDKGNGIYVTRVAGGSTQRYFRARVLTDLDGVEHAYVTPDFGDSWHRVTGETTYSDGNWNAPIGNLPRRGETITPLAKDRA